MLVMNTAVRSLQVSRRGVVRPPRLAKCRPIVSVVQPADDQILRRQLQLYTMFRPLSGHMGEVSQAVPPSETVLLLQIRSSPTNRTRGKQQLY
jgi:hypothetical protein